MAGDVQFFLHHCYPLTLLSRCSHVCVCKGLQIGLPPVLNFGSDEMKKRVATTSVHLNMSGSSHLDLSALLLRMFSVTIIDYMFCFKAPDCLMGRS